jgi:hypothetical protein
LHGARSSPQTARCPGGQERGEAGCQDARLEALAPRLQARRINPRDLPIRRNFIDTWLKAFAAADVRFDFDTQNAARRVVECFFDNVIIEATVQFVEEHQEAVRQLHAGLEPTVAGNAEFVQRITRLLREPLGPLLLGLEVLLREEALSPRGLEMIGVLQRGVKKEARAIEELLRSTELFEKDAAQNR